MSAQLLVFLLCTRSYLEWAKEATPTRNFTFPNMLSQSNAKLLLSEHMQQTFFFLRRVGQHLPFPWQLICPKRYFCAWSFPCTILESKEPRFGVPTISSSLHSTKEKVYDGYEDTADLKVSDIVCRLGVAESPYFCDARARRFISVFPQRQYCPSEAEHSCVWQNCISPVIT